MRRPSLPAVACLVLVLVCPAVGSQTAAPATAKELDALLLDARNLLSARKNADSKAAFERALEAARRLALEPQQATALCGISEALLMETQYRGSREFGLQCLEISERLGHQDSIGRANVLLNNAAESMGDWPEARLRATRAIEAFESSGNLGGRGTATLQRLRAGNLEPAEAQRLTARVVDDARAVGNKGLEASALHNWGDGLFSAARYEEAFDKLQEAAALYDALGNRVALGTVYNSLGRIYRAHGRLEEALRWQLKALDLHQAAGDPLSLMQSLNAVGVVHGLMGHPKEAREFLERALVIAEKSSSPRLPDLLRANIAGLAADAGDFARAASLLEGVIARGADSYPSLRNAQMGLARVQMGQPREGLVAADKAVELCGTVPNDCIFALRIRARAHAALGDQAAALADVTAALNRVEDVRKQLVPADFFKQEFSRAQDGIYGQALALSLSQKQEARALETAELARSRAFLDLLASRAIEPKGTALVYRGPAPASDRGSDLRSAVSASPATLRDIAATATRLGSTMLLYWVADDSVIAWVVTPDGQVRTQRTPVLRSKLDELVRATSPVTEPAGTMAKRAITTRGADAFNLQTPDMRAWRELHDLLIQPVRDALPRARGSLITIVPHGPLLNLSFAALQDARGRYLLEDYTIHYAPAASMLQFTSARARPAGRTGDMLFVADPALPVRSRLDRPLARLPGARAEVAAISSLVPKARVTVLQDARASEDSVRASVDGKAVLHFATHAIVRDDDPFASFLALAPVTGGAGADGFLTAQEVYGWQLNADLIVLSACRSGGGRVTGDGVATFARAFIYAGTPSLVASLWDVADEPTNRLVPGFYRAWLGGQSKARALRAAQLQLLAELRAGKVQVQTPAGPVTVPDHPAYWAGFALIGEPD
jgi:CHAT domain-containing protein/tetratricopeptide (TPR) repeat protein